MKSDNSVVVDVRAIDVGYFSVKFTLGDKVANGGSRIATSIFPSFAPRLTTGRASLAYSHRGSDGTVVNVAGLDYFVGRDAMYSASGCEPREVLTDYSQTDKYLALARGAMHYMALDANAHVELVIRHLIVGLPLTTFAGQHSKLSARLTGEHLLPHPEIANATVRVTVQRTSVIVQPQGTLLSHGSRNAGNQHDGWTLVIDAGGGTLDWYLARGKIQNWERSGAHAKCMLACTYAVADQIDHTWRDTIGIVQKIDKAIREGAASFTTGGQTYYLSAFSNAISAVLDEATDKMISKLGSLTDIDCILLSGGGAKVYGEYFGSRFPHLKKIMNIVSDPIYANVKGFHLAGELMAVAAD